MPVHEVANPFLEEVKHADQHCMEEVGLREVTHNSGNMSKHVKSFVYVAWQGFSKGCLGVLIAEHFI